jgi:hypothetical protein
VTGNFASATGTFASSTASCPAGKRVISGGGTISGLVNSVSADGGGPRLTRSAPDSTGTTWDVTGVAGTAYANQWSIVAYAICVDQ